MNHKPGMMIAGVFAVKFFSQFRNSLVTSFLDLLGRTPEHRFEQGMLGDLCDFVLEKIQENKKNRGRRDEFTFSGRTLTSVIALTNEWHERLRREAEAGRTVREERRLGRKKEKVLDTSKWSGLGLARFLYETDECVWTVTELRTAQDLLNEGRKMKSCIASYAYRCASGESAVFSLERVYPEIRITEKAATLEVTQSKRTLIQAKGKCNTVLTPKIKSIVTRWAQANGITVRPEV